VFVHDQPFSILLFEDGCPAECRLLALARLLRQVRGNRGSDPVNVATFVNLSVVVDLETAGLVFGKFFGSGGLIFIPVVVLQWLVIKKNVRGGWPTFASPRTVAASPFAVFEE
jgi:hypothetical protein